VQTVILVKRAMIPQQQKETVQSMVWIRQ
jgi:hypothetical protein